MPPRGRPGLRRAVPRLLVGLVLVCWCPSPTRPGPAPFPDTRPEAAPEPKPAKREMVFPAAGDAEAWACLPERVRGAEAPLPLWARTLARTLPRTTAAMLELDFAHRAGSPLAAKLRGQVRWAAARALRCDYGEAYALADLRAARVADADIEALTRRPDRLPDETQRVLAFVRRLSTAAYTITDEEAAHLVARYGAKQLVAVVLCVAYANFLDRLTLALGLPVEPGDPVPPLDVRFARRGFDFGSAPARPRPEAVAAVDEGGLRDPDWPPLDLTGVRAGMEAQKGRRPRIPLPDDEPGTNRWGLVGRTYQPALATAWTACTQAFAEEADQEPVFEQSVFWIVTRTKQCFY